MEALLEPREAGHAQRLEKRREVGALRVRLRRGDAGLGEPALHSGLPDVLQGDVLRGGGAQAGELEVDRHGAGGGGERRACARGEECRGAGRARDTRRRGGGATSGRRPANRRALRVRRFRAPSFEARLDASNERTLETRRVFRWLGFFLFLKAFSGGENRLRLRREKRTIRLFGARANSTILDPPTQQLTLGYHPSVGRPVRRAAALVLSPAPARTRPRGGKRAVHRNRVLF